LPFKIQKILTLTLFGRGVCLILSVVPAAAVAVAAVLALAAEAAEANILCPTEQTKTNSMSYTDS
jgi:hypothetical protein